MSEWTALQIKEVATTVVEKAKTDKAFRESLIANPHSAIQAATDQVVPEHFKLNVLENHGFHMTIVLPDLKSDADELSEAELAQVAGGKSGGFGQYESDLAGVFTFGFIDGRNWFN